MIRKSTAIATVAILLSLLVHFTGLTFTSSIQTGPTVEETTTDVIALDNTFEDVAEALSEPVRPEPASVPEPPVEALPEPEPELADVPTSEALVASPDPQHTLSPDTGAAQVAVLDTAGPSSPENSGAPEPEAVEPSGGDDGTTTDPIVTPPVELGKIAEASRGNPDAIEKSEEASAIEPANEPSIAPVPQPNELQRLAALPAPIAPALPVTPALESPEIPVIALESDAVDPDFSETAVDSAAEDSEVMDVEDNSEEPNADLVSSLRPRLPPRRPSVDNMGQPDGLIGMNNIRRAPSQLIESPVTAYQRGRTDLIGRRNGGAQSGGSGFRESRGPGNSDVTNYVGRVLVHLNRVPAVRVSARGAARVFFEINPDGTLAWVDVIDSSGSREVERAAKEQVRIAAPFPLPPNGNSRRLAFVYRIN